MGSLGGQSGGELPARALDLPCCSLSPVSLTANPTVLHSGTNIYLGHFLPVGLGVQWCLRQQGGVLFRGHTKFIIEGVVPDLERRGRRKSRVLLWGTEGSSWKGTRMCRTKLTSGEMRKASSIGEDSEARRV